ncbi:hypothetical protein PVAND_009076 [Polypedilum vanderplanki]|uniref:Uncharacterized protein n=1 Tax=Polypedilum vanderplanki TaxID=319348 RepID=A0A9J6CBI7_POLVA|nr:hypothetical protein PVAND_009076 [Polypedilum vanderplanki]
MFRKSFSKLISAGLDASKRSLTSKSKSSKKKVKTFDNSKSLNISVNPIAKVHTNQPHGDVKKIEVVAEVKSFPFENIPKQEPIKQKPTTTPCTEKKFSPCAEKKHPTQEKKSETQEKKSQTNEKESQKKIDESQPDSGHTSLTPPVEFMSKMKRFELSSKCTSFHIKSCGHEPQ